MLLAYSLGKAQRALAEIARACVADGSALPGSVLLHEAMAGLFEVYRESGVNLPVTSPMPARPRRGILEGCLAIGPPSAAGTGWLGRLGADDRCETAAASGWMRVRGVRRRAGHDRGFVLSDHADWPGLLETIRQSQAARVLVTHGHVSTLVRHLRENGVEASALSTSYGGGEDDGEAVC